MYNSILVANKTIDMINKFTKGKPTIMQLLKLVYITHGWFLAKGKTLLDNKETIEAWPYGPVAIKIYSEFRKQGIDDLEKTEDINEKINKKIDDEDVKLMEEIIEPYSKMNPFALSDLTHLEDTPWTKTVEKYGLYSKIPNKLIKQYYSSL